jgi:hypothetical protein
VPDRPNLSTRARAIAALTLVSFGLSFMLQPIQVEGFGIADLDWVDETGAPIDEAVRAQLRTALAERLAREAPGR